LVSVVVKRSYYARSRPGEEPIRYKAKQPRGVGTTVHVQMIEDPVLRRHKDLQRALEGHEIREAKAWGEGKSNAHTVARRNEPALSKRIGGVGGFWKEVRRREKD
jgi:hypothetical protein